ncbi:uncharacterized protein [Nicotiana sylvestris]|uniref:uncharacterized protein n=1 Tax=Nicotiana sylvestris TaxID=4096 RepID=UPI00388C5988
MVSEQAKEKIQQIEEVKNTKIIELEKELEMLKQLYTNKLKEKEKRKEEEQQLRLTNEIEKFKLQLEEVQDNPPNISINEINDQSDNDKDLGEDYSETRFYHLKLEDESKKLTAFKTTYQDKDAQTDESQETKHLFAILTTLSLQMDGMGKRLQQLEKSQPTPAEILYDEIKPIIQVVKIGLTRDMIIPEEIEQQPEIPKIEIPGFYANKRIIGIATIIQELANNYLQENAIWSYYSRDQLMIYANSRELRQEDMDEVQKWISSLLKPEIQPTTRALKKGFISNELLTRYCKLVGHKYPDHICSKCNGEDNHVPEVQLE